MFNSIKEFNSSSASNFVIRLLPTFKILRLFNLLNPSKLTIRLLCKSRTSNLVR